MSYHVPAADSSDPLWTGSEVAKDLANMALVSKELRCASVCAQLLLPAAARLMLVPCQACQQDSGYGCPAGCHATLQVC